MHVRDARAFERRETVYEKIEECDLFCTEIALDETPTFSPDVFKLPPGQWLDQLLPPKKYQKIRQILWKSFRLNLDALRMLKPMLIANMIDERILEREMPEALDQQLWKYARRRGKTCMGVETVSEQIAFLQKAPVEQQLRGLLAICQNVSAQRRRVRSMTRAYQDGDIYRIYQMARRGSGELRKSIIFRRNREMADRLAKRLPEKTLFFAVGAGHLAGAYGLIRLIKRKGYRLRPI